jgi:hypothetical protein
MGEVVWKLVDYWRAEQRMAKELEWAADECLALGADPEDIDLRTEPAPVISLASRRRSLR